MTATQDLTGIDPRLHDLMEGFGKDDVDMFRALCLGFRLKLFTVGEASPSPDLGNWSTDFLVGEVRDRLIQRGLLPGGPDNPGPLDVWRERAQCPEGCSRDHKPVDEMDGTRGFHHDFPDHCEPFELELDDSTSQAVGGDVTFIPCWWMPGLFIEGPDGLTVDLDPHPVPQIELQDQCKSLLTLHGSEVGAFAAALQRAAEAV